MKGYVEEGKMTNMKNYSHSAQEWLIKDDISAKRNIILEWGIDKFPRNNMKFLKQSFSFYGKLVRNINSSTDYGVGLLYYLGHVGSFEKCDRVIEQAACMDILQISFTMYAYLMRYSNLKEAPRVKAAITSLPYADAMIQKGEGDIALRGLLGCISDYVMILVMKYLDAMEDTSQEDAEFKNQVSEWYLKMLIKIYKVNTENSSDSSFNSFIFQDAYAFGQWIGGQDKRVSGQYNGIDKNEIEYIIRKTESEAEKL